MWWCRFSHYNPMRAICCHGNQSSDPILPKTWCSLSLTPMMLQIKFGCVLPAGLRDIYICLKVWTYWHTDGRRFDQYTINPTAFGSGELKIRKTLSALIHFFYLSTTKSLWIRAKNLMYNFYTANSDEIAHPMNLRTQYPKTASWICKRSVTLLQTHEENILPCTVNQRTNGPVNAHLTISQA